MVWFGELKVKINFFGFIRLYQAWLGLISEGRLQGLQGLHRYMVARQTSWWVNWVNWVNWLNRMWFFHVNTVVGLLTAQSWLGQPVRTMALYRPTKCQMFRKGGRARDSTGDCCEELTLSKWCQFWVTLIEVSAERILTQRAQRGGEGRKINARKNGKWTADFR